MVTLVLLLVPPAPFLSNARALSIDEELILGKKFLAEIRKHHVLLDDDYANEYLNSLGQYLLQSVKTRPFPFHFHIIKDNTLNAFSAPGGQIFFYAGLIGIMDNCDMLAGVMAHEIGHSTARHLSKRIEQNKKIGLATIAGILAGAFLGGVAANALITGSMAAGIQAQLHYSREDERQADQLGFKYATAAGFIPSALTAALKKISQGNWMDTSKMPPYLLTHPTGPERMANLDNMAQRFKPGPPTEQVRRFRARFSVFKTVIRATCLDSYEAERFFQEALKRHPAAVMPHLGLGIVYMNRSEYSAAEDHLQAALRRAPRSLLILKTLGRVYQLKGKTRDAITIFKKALRLKHDDPDTLFRLALSYEDLEAYGEAIGILRRLASFSPTKKEVYYHLGISYGRLNRLALAHLNFGRYFQASGERRKAGFHFNKARELAQGDPALMREITKAMGKKRQEK
ncbi:MAG: M48 family metalloprotease [Deltaproteobacteria bacterium]|nr:M48 family metalloprotease [Deltaproteobacteria bacterium]